MTHLSRRFHFKRFFINLQVFLPPLILVIVGLILSFLNYQPGTVLSGWDNLHPEYNLPLNLKRSFFSVWQEYQSLGLLGGMSHASDLIRQLFLYSIQPFTNIFTNGRYIWVFICLTLGPIGSYFAIRQFLQTRFDKRTVLTSSFLGGLFYLLNLATIQTFYTPFETFHSFYLFFPWIIFVTIKYLNKSNISNLLFLFIVYLLSAPSFYTQTLFLVLCLVLTPILLDYFLTSHKKSESIKSIIISTATLLITQSYWLLPVIFFVITNGSVGLESKINTIATKETYLRNLEFANIPDLALLKGFWFKYLDYSGGQFDYLLSTWRSHLNNPAITTIGFFFFALTVIGLIYSFRKKIPHSLGFAEGLTVCYFFLLGGGLLINQHIPLIGEIFRSPFTKFSIPLSFFYSLFFSVGTIFVFDLFSFLHDKKTEILTTFSICCALIIYLTPAFTGQLISPSMKQRLPQEYVDLINFFKTQDPNTRIANFPQETFWGWNYYSWGYRGSGFLWYGLPQSILDRAFDVWEKSSEHYYEEINAALYSKDSQKFEELLNKYAVNWILIDKNIIAPDPKTNLYNQELKSILENSSHFHLEKNFNDTILVYKTNFDQQAHQYLSLSEDSEASQKPFENLTLRPNTDWQLNNNSLSLTKRLDATKTSLLTIPSFTQTEKLIPVSIAYRKIGSSLEFSFTPVLPEIYLNEKQVDYPSQTITASFLLTNFEAGLILNINNQFYELQLPDEINSQDNFYPLTTTYLPTQDTITVELYQNSPLQKIDLTNSLSEREPHQCYTDKLNRTLEKIVNRRTITLIGTDLVGCLSVPIPNSPDPNALIALDFIYQSNTGTPANASITGPDLNGQNFPQPIIAQTRPTFARVFSKPSSTSLLANLILEANESKNNQEITYTDIQASYLPSIGSLSFLLHSLPSLTIQPENKSETITISLPVNDSRYTVTTDINRLNLNPDKTNCDNFNSGQFDRKVISDGFLYSSTNAISCDQLNLRHLPHETNYALVFDHQFHQGLPMTVCLENHATRRCDVFERLLSTNKSQVLLEPISNSDEPPGFTLHLFNQSIGHQTTENLIKSILVTPLPLNFVHQISYGSEQSGSQTPLQESSHPAEFLYTANIQNDTPQLLNLYQTQSPYWKALDVPEIDTETSLWRLIYKIPFLSQKYPSLNQKNSTWNNQWELPPGSHNLIIFYAPQYLQFLGFGLIILFLITTILFSLIVFAHHRITKSKTKNP